MSEKTILKLYPNGNFETIDTPLIEGTENLYEISTSNPGYIFSGTGGVLPQTQMARYGDFIPVNPGQSYTFQAWWDNLEQVPINIGSWCIGYYYGRTFQPIRIAFQDIDGTRKSYVKFNIVIPNDVFFIRLSANYIENNYGRMQFERGGLATSYKLSIEDLKSQNLPSISFSESAVIVSKIVEYPAASERNYFIEKDSYSGRILGGVVTTPSVNRERASDFIDINEWGQISVRLSHKNVGSLVPEFSVFFYNSNKEITSEFDSFSFERTYVEGELISHRLFNASNIEKYMRLSINHYDNPEVSIKVSVNKGFTTNTKHYLAFEDMPDWVIDTGNPISIFPEGIVIKGDLLQSKS